MDYDVIEAEDLYIAAISKKQGYPLLKGNNRDVKLANRIRWYWFKKIAETSLSYLKDEAKAVIQSKKTAKWWIENREQSAANLIPKKILNIIS